MARGVQRAAGVHMKERAVTMGLARLFRSDAAAARVPEGRRVYAIGDVHGRADLLDDLLARIEADVADGAFEGRPALVFLGDYIDRGLQSRAVIDRVLALDPARYELRFLKGNHEAALLEFLEDPSSGPFWMTIGGAETLYSYGVSAPAFDAPPEEYAAAAAALRAAMPGEHHAFLAALELTARYGDYLFVHAGVRPGRSLDAQDERDLLQIRDPFLRHKGRLGYTVVHGHTPAGEVHQDERRIGLDTGAYATGRLSAIRLQGAERTVFST